MCQELVIEAPDIFSTNTNEFWNLSLEELERIAIENNPALRQAMALIQAARGRALQSGLPPNPAIGFEGQQMASRGLEEQYGIFAEQEFVQKEKLRLSRLVAEQDVQRAVRQWEIQRLRILTDVRTAYTALLRAQQQLDLANEIVKINREVTDVAKRLFEAKEASRIDFLQAELEVQSAEILYQNSIYRIDASTQQLLAVIGTTGLGRIRVSGSLESSVKQFNFDELLQDLVSQSPELALAFATLDRERANLQRQLVEPRSNVTVQGLYNWRDNGAGGPGNGSLVVSMPIPIRNRNQGAIQEARYRVAASEQAISATELSLAQRLAPVFERYQSSRFQAERFETQVLRLTDDTLRLTREAYDAGEIGYMQLLTAQRASVQNRLAYLDSLEALRISEVELIGLLLNGSLNAASAIDSIR